MFRKMRFISLYYSSIDFNEIYILIKGLLIQLFSLQNNNKFQLNNISKSLKNSKIFTFSSARGALSACLNFADIKKGDEIILSSFTCLAVPTAVINVGAKPVYVDINLNSLNNDIDEIIKLINPRVKAIVLQHTLGNSADIQRLMSTLKKKKILIIEDCALSVGTKIENKLLGSFGHASIFSMELSKTISTGWGGVLVLNKNIFFKNTEKKYNNYHEDNFFKVVQDVTQTIISAINNMPNFHFFGKYISYVFFKINLFRYSTTVDEINGLPSKFFISKLSFPFLFLANHQWSRLDSISNKCHKNYSVIIKRLQFHGYTILNQTNEKKHKPISSRIALLVKDRDLVMDFFLKRGIELGNWFDGPLTPIPNNKNFNYVSSSYHNSNLISKHIINIPCHFRLSSNDINLICGVIDDFSLKNPNQKLILKN